MRTEEGMEKARQARAAYNKEHIRTVGANIRKEDAEKFRRIAEQRGTTPGAMLRQFIQQTICEEQTGKREKNTGALGFMYLTERNVTRLMREAAAHNPDGKNPDQLANEILDGYFKLAEKLRR